MRCTNGGLAFCRKSTMMITVYPTSWVTEYVSTEQLVVDLHARTYLRKRFKSEMTESTEMSPAMVEKRFATPPPPVVAGQVGVAEGLSIIITAR